MENRADGKVESGNALMQRFSFVQTSLCVRTCTRIFFPLKFL